MRTACLVCLQVHIRTSPNASPESVGVFVGSDPTNSPPAEFDIYWFFPAWQLAGFSHTPCLSRVGANEDEMKMTMRWQATKRDTRRGTQKRKGKKANTSTDTPSPDRANPEKQGERKSGGTTGQTQTRGGRWMEAPPDTTYKARAKPMSARAGPKPDQTHGNTHEIRDQWGTSYLLLHPASKAEFVIRLKALGCHVKPLGSLRVQPLN